MVHLQMNERPKNGRMLEVCLKKTIRQIRAHDDCDVIIDCTEPGEGCIAGEIFTEKVKKSKMPIKGIELGIYGAEFFNWIPGGKFENTSQLWQMMNQAYAERGIKPEVQIRDFGTLSIVNYLLFTEKNVFAAKDLFFRFRLGFQSGMKATIENLLHLKNSIPKKALWSAYGAGESQFPMIYAALALGGAYLCRNI